VIASGKPHHLPFWGVLFALVASAFADPMPYDSIGNPLNKLPATNRFIQRKGDSLNVVPNRVRVNQAGYRQRDVAAGYAKFYYVGTGIAFDVVNMAGSKVASGTLAPKGGVTVSGQINPYASNSAEHANNGEGDYKTGYPMTGTVVSGTLMQGVLPATLPTGKYIIKVGADTSVPFVVSDNVYAMARDAAIKFFGVARSGDYQSWFHPASHTWDGWLYDTTAKNADGTFKYKGTLTGGWYDCGNHLKEARTNSYPLAALGMLAATMKEKDADRFALNQNNTLRTDGVPDVLREAWVGAQFVFNSYRLAKGKTDSMILTVGDMGPDFGWWGRPENQDAVESPRRGGRHERVLLRNWGSASMSDFAAGLAFISKLYKPYDPAFADSALTIAKAMYETAKSANKADAMQDYSADNTVFDDLGLAATALLWATRDTKYLNEIIYTTGLPNGKGGTCGSSGFGSGTELTRFQGGYFGCGSDGMKKNGGPTDYGSVQSLALYSFAKLILPDVATAQTFGIGAAQRDTLLLRTITQTPGPLWGSSAGPSFDIPVGGQYDPPMRLSYDSIWYSMGIGYGKSGWWNKYQFGNLADLYIYYDMASLVEGKTILTKPGNTDWKRKEVLQVLLGGLNYMFGTNALDISYLYGIGKKNPMHPHHRAANPEGKNVPGAYYNYTIPVGGLYGGLETGPQLTEKLDEKWADYRKTEANCPDAQAAVMIPLMGLASEAPNGPPMPTVKVLYTIDTMAVIQVDLDKWGYVSIGYGLDSSAASQTKIVAGGDTANSIRISIGGLKPATQYFFHVVSNDLQGNSSKVSKWPNGQSDSIPFSFTTKAVPPVPPQFGNIKVCNVTSDSAEIMWYTPNGEYLSSVLWADSVSWKSARYSVTDSDAVGNVPVRFHRVKLYGLKAKTTYNFKVGVPGSYDPTVGCFRTPGEDVKFEIKTTHYMWGTQPAMGIAVVNQDVKSYDSLQIRLYVNGTRAEILDLAARVDIAFKYRADGFIDSGLFGYTKNVQRSRPQLIDPTCPATSSCAWYFDLPMYGATMETQSRWRLDVVFDRHLLERDSTDILNMAPTHDPFTGTDWSFRQHVAGTDNGLSPVDYPGVPSMGKEDIDNKTMDIPVNPYIAVYRRNEFVYGFSPYAKEQATKRTVYAMNVAFDKPFDVPSGNTIEIGTGTSSRLQGTLDPYDVMMPVVKGYITAIWVNGVALSDAQRKAALTRQADGTWKVDLPLRLVTGTNKVDVTFFAGSDSVETVSTGTCDEGKGCAFYNANWYVNYVSNMTPSTISVVDAADRILGLVVPDSSTLRIRVSDGNANKSKTAKDGVTVSVINLRTGRTQVVMSLSETGVNTGVFESELRSAVSAAAVGAQIQTAPGDTILIRYMDAADSADTSSVRIWSQASWASVSWAGIFATCGGAMSVDVLLDKSLKVAGQAAPSTLGGVTLRLRLPSGDTIAPISPAAGGWSVTGSNFDHVQVPVPSSVALRPDWTGAVEIQVPDGRGGFKVVAGSISDSIGPWIDSAKIVENLSGNPVDTLYVWTSETTSPLGKTLPVILRRAGAGVATTGLTVDDASLLDATTGKWVYAIRGGVVKAKDSLRWDPASVSDLHGNAALDCPSLAREVKLVSRPAPFANAWIKDSNGDGTADQVTMVFRKTLVPSDLPDSIEVSFGTGNVVRFAAVSAAMSTDSVLTVPLAAVFPVGETRGSAVDGSGSLKLWKSGEQSGAYALIDSVGPVLLSAKLRFGVGSGADTLELAFSEPVKRSTGTGWLVAKPAFELGTVGVPDSVLATVWKLPVDTSVVAPGDSVRPVPTGKWVDGSNGSRVGALHPWVVVAGGERPPLGGWYQDVDGDGAVDQATVVFAKSPRTRPGMELSWPSKTGFAVTKIDSGAWTLDPDGLTATIAVGPFTQGITSSSTSLLGKWVSNGIASGFPMEDRVAPVIVSAALRYASEDSVPDTLKVRWSEAIAGTSGPLVFHKNTLRGVLPENVAYTQFIPDPDGLGASLLLAAGGAELRKGDSARLAPPVEDRFGNAATDPTVWVPVTFGLRPPRLKTELRAYFEYDGIRPLGTGSAFQTWVFDRDAGESGLWKGTDGSTPADVDSTHFASLTLTLNQVLEGAAYIFDNAGIFVATANFDNLRKMAAAGLLPMDAAGNYQVKFVWDGRTQSGKLASSGVYYMRLVLKFQIESLGKPHIVNRVYTLGFKRGVK